MARCPRRARRTAARADNHAHEYPFIGGLTVEKKSMTLVVILTCTVMSDLIPTSHSNVDSCAGRHDYQLSPLHFFFPVSCVGTAQIRTMCAIAVARPHCANSAAYLRIERVSMAVETSARLGDNRRPRKVSRRGHERESNFHVMRGSESELSCFDGYGAGGEYEQRDHDLTRTAGEAVRSTGGAEHASSPRMHVDRRARRARMHALRRRDARGRGRPIRRRARGASPCELCRRRRNV